MFRTCSCPDGAVVHIATIVLVGDFAREKVRISWGHVDVVCNTEERPGNMKVIRIQPERCVCCLLSGSLHHGASKDIATDFGQHIQSRDRLEARPDQKCCVT